MRSLRLVVLGLVLVGIAAAPALGRRAPAAAHGITSTPAASVPQAAVTGPVAGGRGAPTPSLAAGVDLAALGDTEQEYFVSGTARAFTSATPLSSDGRWSVRVAAQAPYTTRIVVVRPTDPARFSGTVLVEWLNVAAGKDQAEDFGFSGQALLAAGDAYVAVSAQQEGVDGSVPAGFGLKQLDPQRYSSLDVPNDAFAYDIFSQVGAALRHPSGADPLGADRARATHYLADGESLSASRLVTYVDAVAPIAQVFDGYLIHSRGVSSQPLSQAPYAAQPAAAVQHIRTDLTVPVLQVESETDVTTLGFARARQPDSTLVRTWEIAGTAHQDASVLAEGTVAQRINAAATPTYPQLVCGTVNEGQQAQALTAAFGALTAWVTTGQAPPPQQQITTRLAGTAVTAVADAHGNATGGVRMPDVLAPTATLTATGAGPGYCPLYGTTVPLPAAELATLYPTAGSYASQVLLASLGDRFDGVLVASDARDITSAAIDSGG